jgi:hypothetical protein
MVVCIVIQSRARSKRLRRAQWGAAEPTHMPQNMMQNCGMAGKRKSPKLVHAAAHL